MRSCVPVQTLQEEQAVNGKRLMSDLLKDKVEGAGEDRESLETNAVLTPVKEEVGNGASGRRGSGFSAGLRKTWHLH